MSKLEKYQTLIIFIAMPLGLFLGQISFMEQYAENFVTPFLFIMLFGSFLNISLKDYGKAFLNIKFSLTTVLLNFLWTPILVWILGKIFLSNQPIMQIGFIMLMVTPCTDWYLIFTGMSKGNVPLSATVLPLNLVFQVVFLPIYLLIFGGVSGTVDFAEVIRSVVIMLILPFTLAQIGKLILGKLQDKERVDNIYSYFSTAQVFLLSLAIIAMFASKGRSLLDNLNVIAILIVPIVLFYLINFSLVQFIGRCFCYSYEDIASLTLTSIAKNSPMTLGVALMAFPDQPLIHLIMVIEPLIELPTMILISRILLKIKESRNNK